MYYLQVKEDGQYRTIRDGRDQLLFMYMANILCDLGYEIRIVDKETYEEEKLNEITV